MTTSIFALSGYIAWMLLLLLALEVFRTRIVLMEGRAANSFDVSGRDTSDFGHRLTRAHANCYEFFPIFGGVLVMALFTDNATTTDSLSLLCLFARFAQSITHLLSGSNIAVQLRFLFFSIQVAICAWWLFQIIVKLL